MLRGEAGLSPVVATLAERERRARIVRYWRAIEMFSPQQVGRVSPERRMFPVDARRPLPWEQGHALRDAPVPAGMAWRHTVYCGIFRTSAARDVLLEVFGGSEEDHDNRVDGDSALLAFEVTDEGRLLGESITFSSCAWAVGRARSPGPAGAGWLDGFEGDATSCAEVVLDAGDGRLTIVERGGGSRQPFAGMMCEIVLSAAGGAIAPLVAPLLGAAAGAVVGGTQAAAERVLSERRRAGAGHENRDGHQDDEDDEDGPRLGSRQLTVRDLSAVTRWLSDRFGVTTDLTPTAVRVQSRLVSLRRADKATGTDFLNSFIAADLALVAGRLATSEPGKALGDYLTASTAVRTDRRLDLRRNPAAVLAGVEPERFPLGRWPAKTEHPLVRSQQFAVNDILERFADDVDGGVYAVNGPPGTGKTTQLRDLIAGVLVLRAQRLAVLAHPTAAFTGPTHRWTTGHLHRSVCEPAAALVGFEMVVASANNGAVENVSRQIPELESVDEAWRAQASYFPDQGRLVLDGAPAWGALAAPLGNRGNRQDFRDRYWFGTDREKQSASAANGRPRDGRPRNGSLRTGPVPRASGSGSGSGQGMRDLLKRTAQQPPDQGAWRTAVNRFREAERAVRALRDERQPAARALRELPGAQWAVRTGQDAARDADQRHRATLAALTDATERLATLEGDVRRWAERQAEHRRARPGFLQGLFTLGGAQRDWRAHQRPLAEAHRAAEAAHDLQAGTVATHEQARRAAQAEAATAWETARRAQLHRDALEATVATARATWGPHVPADPTGASGAHGAQGDEAEAAGELGSPWSDPEFTAARTRLFLAAMDLHRAFLEGAADRMRKNLDAAMDVLCGDAPKTIPPGAVLAAWRNLFLAVPVVSTTFASLDRMFAGLGADALGWLLIDEAGQATPQMPVGALWRARRAVIVGDPLQLEPVVTLPHTGQQALRRAYGVDEEWVPSHTSAQRVADRLNPHGTYLPAPDGSGVDQVWVGAPLRVHRRCDQPMFDISNRIAYDGLMVHGVSRGDYPIARRGVWWDVPAGPTTQGKWNPAEADAANVIIHRLVDQGLNPATDLFVVSPFRDVVTGLRGDLCRTVNRDHVGTVHTTQGKEADVVLIVLGAGGSRPGARNWAASSPNLLNVAVSRARRRLFVVGDHAAWRGHRYFDVLAGSLHHVTDEEQATMRRAAPGSLAGPCRCSQPR